MLVGPTLLSIQQAQGLVSVNPGGVPGASGSGTEYGSQRKVFYANGYWWLFWGSAGGANGVYYESSTDGKTWGTPTTFTNAQAPINGGTEFSEAATDRSRPGLPRRIRQASLAPQLRRTLSPALASPGRDPALASPEAAADGPLERSPEEASSMLSAMQAGWQRARTENGGYSRGEDES